MSDVLTVRTEVGPRELDAGVVYVHDVELDGAEDIRVGRRCVVVDGAGRRFAGRVAERVAPRWQIVLYPYRQDYVPTGVDEIVETLLDRGLEY